MTHRLLTLAIRHEPDVVAARQRARQIAGLLGFDAQDQTRIATAVSEIARNAFQYAGGGRVEYGVEGKNSGQSFTVRVTDTGPGIPDLPAILEGRFTSRTGMGLGIVGTRRLMDHFAMESAPSAGTTVLLGKTLPGAAGAGGSAELARIADVLARERPHDPFEEIQEQNRELLRTLDELRARQEAQSRLNRELEDTNRGVLALYAELDERAEQLRRANETRAQFLSYMSHEFRSPLDSILALSGLLLDRTDGPLTEEQETQVAFVRRSARDLLDLVDDLLDTASVEAGRIAMRPVPFTVADLFSTLRALMRPLLPGGPVELIFEEPRGIPTLCLDEGRVSQILRNLVSNALKFTERGEVRVSAALGGGGNTVVFSVADTGIGIALEDRERIFQDFTQIESRRQRVVKGTGLGLPLSRKLAELLGGKIAVQSVSGSGSTFFVELPLEYPGPPCGSEGAPGKENL